MAQMGVPGAGDNGTGAGRCDTAELKDAYCESFHSDRPLTPET
jgi:hypothetical protein